MRHTVGQALPSAKCLFFQGAAGNQGPVEGFTGDLGVAKRLGSILGHQAAALALQTETVKREPKFEGFIESSAYQAKQYWRVSGPRNSELRVVRKTIDVPRRRYTAQEIDKAQTNVAEATRKLQQANSSGDKWSIYQAEARLRRFADLLKTRQAPDNPAPIQIAMQVLRIGDIAIFSMPGEPFAEIGTAVKKGSPFAITLFCGYSTGAGGDYIPVSEEYSQGGYEVERTPYGAGADQRIVQEAIQLLQGAK